MTQEWNDIRAKKLHELHGVQIELIRLFVEICEKENLRYFIHGGTLLGAVRHKGFIPWDDDADFAMPRQDYEKFNAVASKYMHDDYYINNSRSNPNHIFYMTQLCSRKASIIRMGMKDKRTENVGIDIDVYDGLPNGAFNRIAHLAKCYFLRLLYVYSIFDKTVNLDKKHRPWYEKVLIAIGVNIPIQKWLSSIKRRNAWENAMKKYSWDDGNYVFHAAGLYKFKEIFKREVFGEGALYEFEGMHLRGPQDYKAYLTQVYGDYMTPPPESERNWHSTEIIEEPSR